jgi:hypothetical protein
MKYVLILILFLICLDAESQVVRDSITNGDSIRIANIEQELRDYGRQSFLTDKITLFQFGVVVVGAAISIPAMPLLIITTGVNLTITIINWRADKKLSKYNKFLKIKHHGD